MSASQPGPIEPPTTSLVQLASSNVLPAELWVMVFENLVEDYNASLPQPFSPWHREPPSYDASLEVAIALLSMCRLNKSTRSLFVRRVFKRLVQLACDHDHFLRLEGTGNVKQWVEQLVLSVDLAKGREHISFLSEQGSFVSLTHLSLVLVPGYNALRIEEFVSAVSQRLSSLTHLSIATEPGTYTTRLGDISLNTALQCLCMILFADLVPDGWKVHEVLSVTQLCLTPAVLNALRRATPPVHSSSVETLQLQMRDNVLREDFPAFQASTLDDDRTGSNLRALAPVLAPHLTCLVLEGVDVQIEPFAAACAALPFLQRLELYPAHWFGNGTIQTSGWDRGEVAPAGSPYAALSDEDHANGSIWLHRALPSLVSLSALHIGRSPLYHERARRDALSMTILNNVAGWTPQQRSALIVAIGRCAPGPHTIVYPANADAGKCAPASRCFAWSKARRGNTALDIERI
ncbi:hypothetical protein AURDEDRAFT_132068 [Auricularia subglabra TFB-10046 SS5]|uniref:Uncharacterized protein n=1 Tax=Auricularia subglabra (strain TFB-10046 / SS5) TaxID=717982 RepID=J0CQX0_AURST|nr:hypothetical protein AURDEDRAFT_132068 [Auricularia subglabra TFB-10046 SS5]